MWDSPFTPFFFIPPLGINKSGINKANPLCLQSALRCSMSMGDVAEALSLVGKGLLSPDSFKKVVARIVRGNEDKEPSKSGAKVGLSLAVVD